MPYPPFFADVEERGPGYVGSVLQGAMLLPRAPKGMGLGESAAFGVVGEQAGLYLLARALMALPHPYAKAGGAALMGVAKIKGPVQAAIAGALGARRYAESYAEEPQQAALGAALGLGGFAGLRYLGKRRGRGVPRGPEGSIAAEPGTMRPKTISDLRKLRPKGQEAPVPPGAAPEVAPQAPAPSPLGSTPLAGPVTAPVESIPAPMWYPGQFVSEALEKAGTLPGLEALQPFQPGLRNPPADVARLRQWIRAAAEGRGPLAGVSASMQSDLYERVYHKGEPLQRVMASVNKALGRPVRVPKGGGVLPTQAPEAAVAEMLNTAVPPTLTAHPFYPTLRKVVSDAFSPDLANPALALSQADAYLGALARVRPPEQIAAAIQSLRRVKGGLIALEPDALFATVNRAFQVPGFQKVAGKGRRGAEAAAAQAARAKEAVAQQVAGVMTIGDVISNVGDPVIWERVLGQIGMKADSDSVLGLMAMVGQRRELHRLPASALPRLMADMMGKIPQPFVEGLDRLGLERYLVGLFGERITPSMLGGMDDGILRTAVRSAENMLKEGHGYTRAADIAAMHLGAPNAAKLLVIGSGNAWKQATLTGDPAPVFLKALVNQFGRMGVEEVDILAVAEAIATREGTDIGHALGYLAHKAGIPVGSISSNVARQYLKQLGKMAGTDPDVQAVFREVVEAQEIGTLPRGFQIAGPEVGLDDLVTRSARMVEAEGLEASDEMLRALTGAGQAVEQRGAASGEVQIMEALQRALEGGRITRKKKVELIQKVGQALQSGDLEGAAALVKGIIP